MSQDLKMQHGYVMNKINSLLDDVDETLKDLYLALLESDPEDGLDEARKIARLEGFHDYIVVRQETRKERPSLEDFLDVQHFSPDKLLSFSTGRYRADVENHAESVEPAPSEEVKGYYYGGVPPLSNPVMVESVLVVTEDTAIHDTPLEIEPEVEPEHVEETAGVEDEAAVNEEPVPEQEAVEESLVPAESLESEHQSIDVTEQDSGEEGATQENEPAEDPVAEPFVSVWQDEDEETEVSSDTSTEPSVPGRLDANAVASKEFSFKRNGYNCDQVDDMLDNVVIFLKRDHSVEEYERMIDLLKNAVFKPSGLAKGFNQIEVDGFVEAIISELRNRSSGS